jgi:hypothetical protein
MSEFDPAEAENATRSARRERKPWSTPRLIVSELQSTESGASNVPEASGGLLSS